MASYEDVKEESYRRLGRTAKKWIGWLGSMTLSLMGGLILAWWELNYHLTNHQQWMVPLGLILLVTPLIVCFAVFSSDFCNPNDPYISTKNPPDTLPDNPFHDPEI
ncbi:hypothetical protein Salat_1999800 [Sesamum alatum]|uniref:Uncharacterized protein n=1 Tax=Sesamum alatum TaxID=300844 RepID=A0AAE1XZH6_9LAMI|nr:hypothetical protein Salat_1999800 [Sesamum alatum]